MKRLTFVFAILSTISLSEETPVEDSQAVQDSNAASAVSEWADDIFGRSGKGGKCKKIREAGNKTTGAEAPVQSWGTPIPDMKTRVTRLQPTTEIGNVMLLQNDIRIGTKDFAFVGCRDEILAFCACYEKVTIQGRSLQNDGKWKDNTGEIKIQLQDASHYNDNEFPLDLLFKVNLDRVVKHLDPLNPVVDTGVDADVLQEAGVTSAETMPDLKKAWVGLKEVLPLESETLAEVLGIAQEPGEKTRSLLELIKKRDDEIDEKWIGVNNIPKNKRIIVLLTMYDKPIRNSRATYNMNTPTTTFRDVGDKLKSFFKF